ncbi:molybdopterin-binding protein [Halorhabdus sp. CUG00001]|uniref:competence/damage-inducible protein A n=1 Tax=Halorhabdus sp. CUG00001 TaxID=2600297 RepID=UPI00131AAFFD|nr:molybdopterin-binding protein [Halorhabdus sp. CUG00001]
MDVSVLTVGEELLAGDIDNTNGTWLASALTARGVSVRRILTVPDDRDVIAERTRAHSEAFDAVIVTGGIGGTPDDVTMEAVADAFDRTLVASDLAIAHVQQRLAAVGESVPELDIDIEAEAAIPEGAKRLSNPEGLAPGCRLDNVYVLPGIPSEMRAMFETIAEEFTGEVTERVLYTVEPEANIVTDLTEARDRFEIRVGCYPDKDARHNRLKLTGADETALDDAAAWLLDTIDASETPVEREWDPDEEPTGGPE